MRNAYPRSDVTGGETPIRSEEYANGKARGTAADGSAARLRVRAAGAAGRHGTELPRAGAQGRLLGLGALGGGPRRGAAPSGRGAGLRRPVRRGPPGAGG